MSGTLYATSHLLAATNWQNPNDVVTSSAGAMGILKNVFALVGVVIVVVTLFKVVQAFLKNQIGKSASTAVGGLVLAVLCFNITVPLDIVSSGGGLLRGVVCSVSTALGSPSSSSCSATTPAGGTAPPAAPAAPAAG